MNKGEIVRAMEMLVYINQRALVESRMTYDEDKRKELEEIIKNLDKAYYSLVKYKNL